MCSHSNTVATDYSVICTCCGLERPLLVNIMDYPTSQSSAPLTRLYNRGDRWTSIVKKIVGIHSGPNNSDPVWKYLEDHKDSFTSPKDIVKCLQKSNLKNKHYPCIHLFTKTFYKGYTAPQEAPGTVIKMLATYFQHILQLWSTCKSENDQFFSYNWLIEQGLHLYGLQGYFPYVKLLKCPHRRQRYVHMLLRLYETRVERRNHEQSDNRSPHDLSNPSIRHNQSQKLPHPEAQIAENHPTRFFQDSQLDHLYKCAISRGTPGKS